MKNATGGKVSKVPDIFTQSCSFISPDVESVKSFLGNDSWKWVKEWRCIRPCHMFNKTNALELFYPQHHWSLVSAFDCFWELSISICSTGLWFSFWMLMLRESIWSLIWPSVSSTWWPDTLRISSTVINPLMVDSAGLALCAALWVSVWMMLIDSQLNWFVFLTLICWHTNTKDIAEQPARMVLGLPRVQHSESQCGWC